MQVNVNIVEDLRSLRATLLRSNPAEKDVVVAVGAGLEALQARLSGVCWAEALLAQSLQVLQALYGGQVADGRAAFRAVARALEAVALGQSDAQAGQQDAALAADRLAKILSAPTPPVDAMEISPADLAAQLVVLGPDDRQELDRIRTDLQSLAAANAAEGRFVQALQCLDSALSGQASDARTALGQAAELLAAEPTEPRQPPADTAAKDSTAPAPQGTAAPKDAPAAAADLCPEIDGDLKKEYVEESLDHIASAEAALLEIETEGDHTEQINAVFRAFHTIKGTSGFLGLERIQRTAHLAENLLDQVRSGSIRLAGRYADLALQACDALKTMIAGLKDVTTGEKLPLPEDLGQLLADLEHPHAGDDGEDPSVSRLRLGDILVAKNAADRQAIEEVAGGQGDKPLGQALVEQNVAKAVDVVKALRTQKQMDNRGGGGDSTVRVGTDRLDTLINMVGELVIAQSMVAQNPTILAATSSRLSRSVLHSGKIIRELQDLTMSLRMVPLKATFQKMARLVRDLARKSGKSVQFATEGEDTEIDRNMVEMLGDPLVHMMRNAVDHGVEAPDVRRQSGKPAEGTVRLRAFHAAGHVVLELSDDGKGLDRKRILSKAVEKGLIEPGRELTDAEAFNLVFLPGFSTAEKVTDVSGRGVGMDVVKRSIETLRGRIDIASRVGEGSTFTLRLPLTMAIADAMLLRVGREQYLLPTISIEQSFRPPADSISTVHGRGEMVQLRGQLLPLFRLYKLFAVEGAVDNPCQALLVIVEGRGRRCALMVDDLVCQQQVVIKTLGRTFANVQGVAGGAILGDGQVGLILDAAGIVALAHGGQAVERAA